MEVSAATSLSGPVGGEAPNIPLGPVAALTAHCIGFVERQGHSRRLPMPQMPARGACWRRHLAIFLIGAAIGASASAGAQTMEERARNAAAASRSKSSDSEAIRGNYLEPALSGGTVASIDGKASFSPRISCASSATMLEIMVQPGSTGDIGRLSVARDTDLDGHFDSNVLMTQPISGICANGVISCQAGSWNGCRPLAWDAHGQDGLRLVEVTLPELSGCYCVNNSCGSNLVSSNFETVLKDLGGGVVGAITTADPRIGVAQAGIEGPVIRYVGSQTTACASDPHVSQTSYRADPTLITQDAFTASRSSSVFQTLAGSPVATGRSHETRSCSIVREIDIAEPDVDAIIARSSGGYATTQISQTQLRFLMGSPADNSLKGGRCTIFDYRMTIDVRDPDRLTSLRLNRYFGDDWVQLRIDGEVIASGPAGWTGNGLPPGTCERKSTYHASPMLDLKPLMPAGLHEVWLRVAVADEGEAYAEIEAELDLRCNPSERVVDMCAPLSQGSQCSLVDESVDDVVTIKNGVATGLHPLPQVRQFGTGRCSYQYAREFFTKRRRYSCMIDSGTVSAPDVSRGAYILDRSTETMLADRTIGQDGSVTQSTRAFRIPDRPPVAACEPICKTRAPKANDGVGEAAPVATLQTSPTGWNSFYHGCDSAGQCPLGPGEELVSACGCLDDFPEAVTMMQSLRLAGADISCNVEAR